MIRVIVTVLLFCVNKEPFKHLGLIFWSQVTRWVLSSRLVALSSTWLELRGSTTPGRSSSSAWRTPGTWLSCRHWWGSRYLSHRITDVQPATTAVWEIFNPHIRLGKKHPFWPLALVLALPPKSKPKRSLLFTCWLEFIVKENLNAGPTHYIGWKIRHCWLLF